MTWNIMSTKTKDDRINSILDKISKHGYESLTKEEKRRYCSNRKQLKMENGELKINSSPEGVLPL